MWCWAMRRSKHRQHRSGSLHMVWRRVSCRHPARRQVTVAGSSSSRRTENRKWRLYRNMRNARRRICQRRSGLTPRKPNGQGEVPLRCRGSCRFRGSLRHRRLGTNRRIDYRSSNRLHKSFHRGIHLRQRGRRLALVWLCMLPTRHRCPRNVESGRPCPTTRRRYGQRNRFGRGQGNQCRGSKRRCRRLQPLAREQAHRVGSARLAIRARPAERARPAGCGRPVAWAHLAERTHLIVWDRRKR